MASAHSSIQEHQGTRPRLPLRVGTSASPLALVQTRDFLLHALDKAAELGSRYLGGTFYGALGLKTIGGATFAERATCARVLSEVAAAAQARGIVLGLEPVNRYESNLFNTIADILTLSRAIGAATSVNISHTSRSDA